MLRTGWGWECLMKGVQRENPLCHGRRPRRGGVPQACPEPAEGRTGGWVGRTTLRRTELRKGSGGNAGGHAQPTLDPVSVIAYGFRRIDTGESPFRPAVLLAGGTKE